MNCCVPLAVQKISSDGRNNPGFDFCVPDFLVQVQVELFHQLNTAALSKLVLKYLQNLPLRNQMAL